MAVEPVAKVLVAVHESDRDRFFRRLQRSGLLHVSRDEGAAEPSAAGQPESARLVSAIEFLQARADKRAKARPVLSREEFEAGSAGRDYQHELDRLDRANRELAETDARLRQVEADRQRLAPWRPLAHDVRDVYGLTATRATFLRFPDQAEFDRAAAALAGQPAELRPVSTADSQVFAILVQSAGGADAMPAGIRHEVVDLHGVEGRPAELLARLDQDTTALAERKAGLAAQLASVAAELPRLKAAADALERQRALDDAADAAARTASVRLVSGWVRRRELARLERLVAESGAAAMAEVAPAEGEEPPVALVNRPALRPFEMVLELFSMPSHSEMDPTWLIAPFFGAFFALCLTDAGYGAVVALVVFLMLRRPGLRHWLVGLVLLAATVAIPLAASAVTVATGSLVYGWLVGFAVAAAAVLLVMTGLGPGNKLLGIVLIGAILTIPAGALVGGWFGDIPDRLGLPGLAEFKNRLMWFDPVKDPMKFFILSLALGYLQMISGIAFEIADCLRVRNWGDALLGQLPWFAFLNGLTARVVLAKQVGTWGGAALVVAVLASVAAVVVFTQRARATLLAQWLWFGLLTATFVTLGAKFGWLPAALGAAWWAAVGLLAAVVLMAGVSVVRGGVKPLPAVLGVLAVAGLALYLAGVVPWFAAALPATVFFALSPAGRGVLAKLLWGGYALYGATSYIGVVLSYIRLMALGMCTGGVAVAINVIAWMVLKIPVVGIGAAIIVLVGGHTYNIAVNVLGAFVHSLRLQYVEFFPRFYAGGGSRFEPLREKFNYITLKN